MGWLRNPVQTGKEKAKEVAHNATHANCYRCGEEGLKAAMKHEKDWGKPERWRCRGEKACDKRRARIATEGAFRGRRTGRAYRDLGRSGEGWEG